MGRVELLDKSKPVREPWIAKPSQGGRATQSQVPSASEGKLGPNGYTKKTAVTRSEQQMFSLSIFIGTSGDDRARPSIPIALLALTAPKQSPRVRHHKGVMSRVERVLSCQTPAECRGRIQGEKLPKHRSMHEKVVLKPYFFPIANLSPFWI